MGLAQGWSGQARGVGLTRIRTIPWRGTELVIIDLIGWITFALLIIGAGWAAWRVYGDMGKRHSQVTEQSPAAATTTPRTEDASV